MNPVRTSSGESFVLTPLMDSGSFVFNSIIIKESVFNEVPEIILNVTSQEDLAELGSIHTLKLNYSSDGLGVETKCYLYDVKYESINQTLKLLVCEPDFLKVPYTESYKGIDSVINSCYSGVINDKPISTSNLTLYQRNETNFEFLTKMLYGLKKDVAFGYSISGLSFLDLQNTVPTVKMDLQSQFNITEIPEITNPTNVDYDTEILEEFTNHKKIKYKNQIFDVNDNYAELLETLVYNRNRLNKPAGKLSANTRSLYHMRILDMINFKSIEGIVRNYYVVSRVMTVDKEAATTDYTFYSIDPNKQ